MVDAERDKRIAAGFLYLGIKFQAREIDRQNITGKALAAQVAISNGAQPNDLYWNSSDMEFAWIAANNELVPMDAQSVVAFAQAADLWVTAHYMAARTVKDQMALGQALEAPYTDDIYWPTRADAEN